MKLLDLLMRQRRVFPHVLFDLIESPFFNQIEEGAFIIATLGFPASRVVSQYTIDNGYENHQNRLPLSL